VSETSEPVAKSTDVIEESAPQFELSVIIPARNEEAALPECLASLLAQNERGFILGEDWEILLVDDESNDRTGEIAAAAAAENPGVQVLAAPPLDLSSRGGFTGKNNACWAGAQAAGGKWLLFTDADTVHEIGDLSRAMHEAKKYKVDLLSYSPRQIVTGFWQRAVMPLVFSELASVYPPKQINDPAKRIAAANGQFLLVESDSYFAIGGHRGVGPEVLEDVAIARRIKRSNRGIRFRYAPDALAARMYRTLPEMIEGWTKNLALLFPSPIYLALWRILDLLLFFVVPAIAFTWPHLGPLQKGLLLLIWLRTLWRFYSRVARSNFPAVDCALAIAGIPLFVYLLLRSYVAHRINKSVRWKGRDISAARQG
jgi:glycosyltransferase involved in cell wall biosynthesis